jgi:L-fuconolactonase
MANARPWLLDTAWMSSPAAMDVWKACADLGTPMTMIMFMNQLPYLLPLVKIIAKQFPELPILLDHGAMPFGMTQYEVKLAQEAGEPVVMPPAPDFGIDRTIRIFEDVPNVYFKITEINFERCVAADLRAARIVRRMVDSFGPDRLMWGSDIGQSMLWTYAEKTQMAREATPTSSAMTSVATSCTATPHRCTACSVAMSSRTQPWRTGGLSPVSA